MLRRNGFLGGGIGPVALKRSGKWYMAGGAPLPIAAYQPKGAASLAASYVNLANPGTYNAAPGEAPTLVANGWQGNGTSTFLATGVAPANNQGWTLLIRVVNGATVTGAKYAVGATNGTTAFFGVAPDSGAANHIYLSGGVRSVAGKVTAGVLGFAGVQPYLNGVAEIDTIPSAAGTLPALYLLSRNNNSTADSFWNGIIAAFAIWDSVLTAPQVAAVSAAMAAV